MRAADLLAALSAPDTELGQVLALLSFAGVAQPLAVQVGDGDRLLLRYVERLTGSAPEVVAACPGCGTENVARLTADALPAPAPGATEAGDEDLPEEGTAARVRPPTYADLVGIPAAPEAAAQELLHRCTVGRPIPPPTLGELAAVDDSLAGPLVLACSGCDGPLVVPLDVQRLVLEAVDRYLAEVDWEVHLLAATYHWDLGVIEDLPDVRRRRLARFAAGPA